MRSDSARREYLQGVAEFQRALREFSFGMSRVLSEDDPETFKQLLGPRKPAKRAPPLESPQQRAIRA
jgi:hypothetical protein